jgi:N-glycosylase/DNA lyase
MKKITYPSDDRPFLLKAVKNRSHFQPKEIDRPLPQHRRVDRLSDTRSLTEDSWGGNRPKSHGLRGCFWRAIAQVTGLAIEQIQDLRGVG